MFNGHDCNLCNKRCPGKLFLKVHLLRQYGAKIEYFPIFLFDNAGEDYLSVTSWQFANYFPERKGKGKKQVGAELGQVIYPVIHCWLYLVVTSG